VAPRSFPEEREGGAETQTGSAAFPESPPAFRELLSVSGTASAAARGASAAASPFRSRGGSHILTS